MSDEAATSKTKKGLSPWAWVGIGCGGLLVVGLLLFIALSVFVFKKGKEALQEASGSGSFQEFVDDLKDNPVKTAAEMAINVNPDLELLSTDDEAGTITFRNTKTGEKATLDFQDIAEGRFSVKTDEGTYSMDADVKGQGGVTLKGPEGEARLGAGAGAADFPEWLPLYPGAGNAQGAYQGQSGDARSGLASFATPDGAAAIVAHYKKIFEEQGYEIRSQSSSETAQGTFASIVGRHAELGREINVGVIEQGGSSTITLNYNGKIE